MISHLPHGNSAGLEKGHYPFREELKTKTKQQQNAPQKTYPNSVESNSSE